MDAQVSVTSRRNWFLWGVLLVWAPAIPLIIGLSNTFRGVSERTAIGLGAVAGGLAEAYLLFGLAATLAFQVGGIVLLARSASAHKPMRTAFSIVSIGWSALTLLLLALFFLLSPVRL